MESSCRDAAARAVWTVMAVFQEQAATEGFQSSEWPAGLPALSDSSRIPWACATSRYAEEKFLLLIVSLLTKSIQTADMKFIGASESTCLTKIAWVNSSIVVWSWTIALIDSVFLLKACLDSGHVVWVGKKTPCLKQKHLIYALCSSISFYIKNASFLYSAAVRPPYDMKEMVHFAV